MIPRRIAVHVKAQNWFAVFLDFIIVVAGVFIGIQVSNWNAARIERGQEREYLSRLREDFLESGKGQTRDLDFLDQQLSDQAAILKSLDACAVAPGDAEAFQRGVNTLGYINPPRLFRRTIDEMAAAGKTDIIRNGAIKEQLAAIIALVEWRANGYESIARITEHHRFIVEDRVRYDLSRTFAEPFIGDFVAVDFDIAKLCQDPAMASSVSAISYFTRERRRAFQPILDQYRALLPLIERELRDRWDVDLGAGGDIVR
jgi:hypothetical protein